MLEPSVKQKLLQRIQQLNAEGKDLDDLNDESGQAALYAVGPDKKRLIAVLHKVTHLFEAVEDTASLPKV
jgi:hypothetical protein